MPFVYRYVNKKNGKSYIGVTSRLDERKMEHARANKALVFHRAIKKHGLESFTFYILLEVDSWEDACLAEQQFIVKYDSYRNGYNSTMGGDGSFGRKGELCVASKLTEEVVRSIITDSCCATEAAKKYGTTRKNVEAIRNGVSWANVDRSDAPEYENRNHNTQLTEEIVNKIVTDQCSHKTASEKYGVNKQTVFDVRKGKSWKYIDRYNAPTYQKYWEER